MAGKERVKELLERAAGLPPAERAEFLLRECGDDQGLRREVEELLEADENSSYLTHSVAFRYRSGDDTLGKILGGRYRIVEALGKGGMGRVYLAEDIEIPALRFAVKIFEQGFEKEVEALARVRSDHVVKIVTTGRDDDGRPFMVMEHLSGQTLADLLEKRGPLPREEVAQLVRKIGEAVTELHETKTEPGGRGIIHRDLKPSNIMAERRRGGWEVKLFDLGIARLDNPRMARATTGHAAVGTPLYMSPEQFHGEGMAALGCPAKSPREIITPATDVYSLGVISYLMVAGRHPFRDAAGGANVATMQHQNGYAEALNRRGDIPAAARQAVLKAMSFCPDRRYQRADEFGEQLAAALTAPAPSRVKYAAVAAVALLVLLAAGSLLLPANAPQPANGDHKIAGASTAGAGGNEAAGADRGSVAKREEGGAAGGADPAKGDAGGGTSGEGAAAGERREGQAPPSGPAEREVAYWLVTQERRDGRLAGEPKVITAEEGLNGGWNFKLFFSGRERGHLYLINDWRSAASGPRSSMAPQRSMQILFPIPNDPARGTTRNNGTSEVAPGQAIEAFDGVVGRPGTEHLWVIWSPERIPELERLTEYAVRQHRGRVTSETDAKRIREFLSRLTQAEVKYDEGRRAVLRGAGSVLAKELLLRHA